MFIIGPNSKHVHVAFAFHKLSIVFWLTQVDIFQFLFLTIPKKYCDEIKTKACTLSIVSGPEGFLY